MKNDIHDLALVLESRLRLVLIESWDERRVLETLSGLAVNRGMTLHVWSVTEGLRHLAFGGEALDAGESCSAEVALRRVKHDPLGNLYVFCDLHPFLDEPRSVRLLKEIAMAQGPSAPTLVLVSHALKLPLEVQRYAARFSLTLPSEEELLSIVRDEATVWSERNRGARVRTDNRTLQQVVKNLRGLSHAEARSLAHSLICDDGAITQEDLPELNRKKFELLDMEGVLGFEYETERFADVGGLQNLKRWLVQRQAAFVVAGLWGLPLLRLDFACLYNKFFGETERNLREALKLAEQMAPCVLWMDELEKGLATGEMDGGVSQRVLGTLLTWMAEREAPVFMVATANAVDRLPPELLRKGRFDELFFVDLPDASTRAEIFRIHLARRELKADQFDLEALAVACDGFSGAEIEQVVVSAVYAGQAQSREPDQDMLLHCVRATAPLSVVMAEKLDELRGWASGRAVLA